MTQHLLSMEALKDQAKRLRTRLATSGEPVSQSQALEVIARHHGFRDWNTLCAHIKRRSEPPVARNQKVRGTYLGQFFTAKVVSIEVERPGWFRIELALDDAIDVVASERFSGWRRRLRAVIDADGVWEEGTRLGSLQLD